MPEPIQVYIGGVMMYRFSITLPGPPEEIADDFKVKGEAHNNLLKRINEALMAYEEESGTTSQVSGVHYMGDVGGGFSNFVNDQVTSFAKLARNEISCFECVLEDDENPDYTAAMMRMLTGVRDGLMKGEDLDAERAILRMVTGFGQVKMNE